MEKRPASPISRTDEPPTKSRRNARACLHCRSRKQKCPPPSPDAGSKAPCDRCQQLSLRCSFEVETVPELENGASPSKVVEYILDLQRRLNEHEDRIMRLEGFKSNNPEDTQQIGNFERDQSVQYDESLDEPSMTNGLQSQEVITPQHELQLTKRSDFSMKNVPLESPFATLRSMGENSQHKFPNDSGLQTAGSIYSNTQRYDPVSRGILTSQEAIKAVETYFTYCHPNAPFVSERFKNDPLRIRGVSPSVFLTICSISTRFWKKELSGGWISHPKIFELMSLVDNCISRLLLRPIPSDINLDSVQALLLYAQWMPYNEDYAVDDDLRTQKRQGSPKSRYNDISAWAVLGLAARYAKLLHLQRESNSTQEANKVGQDNSARLRTYCNLISCDFNLMLSSGLPVSIDPTSTQRSINGMSSDQHSQLPGDLRVTGLIELTSLTYQALTKCGDFSGRKMNSKSLKALNADFDLWERTWIPKLNHTKSQHNQLPFTSVRWYRLALNSAYLVPFLSYEEKTGPQQSQLLQLQFLEISLNSACQIIFSHSSTAAHYVSNIESQQPSSFPEGAFDVDPEALERMQYAVDSAWISYTFAVTFLVLCFVRRIIDDNLQLCNLNSASMLGPCHPSRPRSTSIISRLLRLALDVSSGMQNFSRFCPGRDFRRIIENAASLVGVTSQEFENDSMESDAAMQSILDLIHDSGLEWPESLYSLDNNTTNDWAF